MLRITFELRCANIKVSGFDPVSRAGRGSQPKHFNA